MAEGLCVRGSSGSGSTFSTGPIGLRDYFVIFNQQRDKEKDSGFSSSVRPFGFVWISDSAPVTVEFLRRVLVIERKLLHLLFVSGHWYFLQKRRVKRLVFSKVTDFQKFSKKGNEIEIYGRTTFTGQLKGVTDKEGY